MMQVFGLTFKFYRKVLPPETERKTTQKRTGWPVFLFWMSFACSLQHRVYYGLKNQMAEILCRRIGECVRVWISKWSEQPEPNRTNERTKTGKEKPKQRRTLNKQIHSFPLHRLLKKFHFGNCFVYFCYLLQPKWMATSLNFKISLAITFANNSQ